MNRIVLIGNGFDLAHGLKTSYADFINWYWEKWRDRLIKSKSQVECDKLCSFNIHSDFYHNTLGELINYYSSQWCEKKAYEFVNFICNNLLEIEVIFSPLIKRIKESVEKKNWVDIEADYYDLLKDCLKNNSTIEVSKLHEHFAYLQEKLIEYLLEIQVKSTNKDIVLSSIKEKIYEPIILQDIAVGAEKQVNQFISERIAGKSTFHTIFNYQAEVSMYKSLNDIDIENLQVKLKHDDIDEEVHQKNFALLPENIMVVNFNYTNVAGSYLPDFPFHFLLNNIHGTLDNPQSVIFGYGDEMDKHYQELEDLNDNNYLTHIKSSKYLDASNYRKLLQFAESAPFQIYIMGHSCGNSDRTLLNTLFEHENCISIKPFYYQKKDGSDNYTEIAQNISRNFKDKQALRAKVVPKDCCEPLPQASAN